MRALDMLLPWQAARAMPKRHVAWRMLPSPLLVADAMIHAIACHALIFRAACLPSLLIRYLRHLFSPLRLPPLATPPPRARRHSLLSDAC